MSPISKEEEAASLSRPTALEEEQSQLLLLRHKGKVLPCSLPPKKMCADAETAISFRGAFKHYGRGARKVPILVGLDMTIPRGAIYGLLGPSGCGKTTLLQCIVGKKCLKSGEVVVFGGTPGSAEAGVPGTRVGYMPQELALYGEFTIAETLQYFGRIFNMPKETVEKRTEFLLDFLDLPKGKRLIMNLSGGQQRRASLAAALLHEPELLILDEPTVGVDPLLRQCIWSHLLEISKSSHLQTTIVITTHYIEEARQANLVGMMRFGKLLTEGHPDTLLQQYDKPTLEDVFLHLCLGDESDREAEKTALEQSIANGPVKVNDMEEGNSAADMAGEGNKKPVENIPLENIPPASQKIPAEDDVKRSPKVVDDSNERPAWRRPSKCSFLSCHRFAALLMKNFIRMWRNIGFLIFQFIIPTIQVSLFCLAIGRDPTGMTMAVFNEDITTSQCEHHTYGCILGGKYSWMRRLFF